MCLGMVLVAKVQRCASADFARSSPSASPMFCGREAFLSQGVLFSLISAAVSYI